MINQEIKADQGGSRIFSPNVSPGEPSKIGRLYTFRAQAAAFLGLLFLGRRSTEHDHEIAIHFSGFSRSKRFQLSVTRRASLGTSRNQGPRAVVSGQGHCGDCLRILRSVSFRGRHQIGWKTDERRGKHGETLKGHPFKL